MALVLNGSGVITGVTDLATAGVTLDDAALTNPVVTGGVYLGGTGAANYLDDYEEGTWSPSLFNSYGNTPTALSGGTGYYVKIGKKVFCSFTMIFSDSAAVAEGDGAIFTGLPFAPNTTTYGSSSYSGTGTFLMYGGIGGRNNSHGTCTVKSTDSYLYTVVTFEESGGTTYTSDVRGTFSYETA